MSISGACHCGGVTIRLPSLPARVKSCRCSLCTKLGSLMVYFPESEVTIAGDTVAYIWGDRMIGIHHCAVCGCHTHWRSLGEDFGRMGINARLLDGFDVAAVEVEISGGPDT